MFQVRYSSKIADHLKAANKVSPSVTTRLQELEENPLGRAKPTGISAIGEYYINAGRYCLLIDIDLQNEIVTILSVRLSPFLDKVLKGKIQLEVENDG